MRSAFLVPLVLFGCSSGSIKTPDAAAPSNGSDMSVARGATMLAAAAGSAPCLAVDASNVYWIDQGATTRVLSLPLQGGAAPATVATLADGSDKRDCVASDGSAVYYFDGSNLMRATPAGSVSTLAGSQHFIDTAPLVASGGYVYWATDVYGDVDAYSGLEAIVRVPTTGGAVSVVTNQVMGNPGSGGLAVDGNNVYYSDGNGLFALSLTAGSAPMSFTTQATIKPSAMAYGNASLAINEVTGIGTGDIALFHDYGGSGAVLWQSNARPLAVDDKGVYIENGDLERLALDGSGAKILATQRPYAVALTGDSIYFTDGTALWMLPR